MTLAGTKRPSVTSDPAIGEEFSIDLPETVDPFTQQIYDKLKALAGDRKGISVTFKDTGHARKTINTLAVLAVVDDLDIFAPKIAKSNTRRMYARPAGE